MKNILPFFILIILIISCTSDKKETKTISQPAMNMDFIKIFEGKIDGKFDYYAKIKSNKGIISGSYFYKNKCQKTSIQGSLDSLGNIKLKEYGDNSNLIGLFSGKMVNGQKFEGNWSEKEDSKKYPFYFI